MPIGHKVSTLSGMTLICLRRVFLAILLVAACCLTWSGNTVVAQTTRKSPPAPVPAEPPAHIKIVAGIVGEGGTVRYLPRVTVRLMPKAYSDAERVATDAFSAEIDAFKRTRDTTIKKLVEGRRSELATAKKDYDRELRSVMENVTLDAFLTTPDCLMHDRLR